jgi:hypothetical protein
MFWLHISTKALHPATPNRQQKRQSKDKYICKSTRLFKLPYIQKLPSVLPINW